jgi:hypothetical protein
MDFMSSLILFLLYCILISIGFIIIFEYVITIFEDLATQFSSHGMISLISLLDIAKFQLSKLVRLLIQRCMSLFDALIL